MTSSSSARWQWGVPADEQPDEVRKKYGSRAPKFLSEVLQEFPDPDSVDRHSETASTKTSKLEDTLSLLDERHREQRRRLLERHVSAHYSAITAATNSLENDDDFLDTIPINPETSFLKGTLEQLRSAEAHDALARLPAASRTSLLHFSQFTTPTSRLSCDEFAATIGSAAADRRREMLSEEQELRMMQLETRELFWKALMRQDPDKYKGMRKGGLKREREEDDAREKEREKKRKMSLSEALERGRTASGSAVATDPRKATDPRLGKRGSVVMSPVEPSETKATEVPSPWASAPGGLSPSIWGVEKAKDPRLS